MPSDSDGPVGRLQGLVIDPCDHHATHVLLQAGHLWGRKEVAIPISIVARVDESIRIDLNDQTAGRRRSAGPLDTADNRVRLKLTKQQVQDLPTVNVDHPHG